MITPSFSLTATERVLPKLALDFTTGSLDPRITFTRTTDATQPATYTNSNGLIVEATNDQPRFDYDPITLACKGLLIEESRLNNALYSSEFDNSYWSKVTCVISQNAATAPDGTLTADKIIMGSGVAPRAANNYGVLRYTTLASGTYQYSFYAKAGEVSAIVIRENISVGSFLAANLSTVTIGGSSSQFVNPAITDVGNGWCRVTWTTPAGVTAMNKYSVRSDVTGDGVSGFYLWGYQVELGTFATSYIPTTSAALTRNADVAVMTGTNFSDWFNASEGTFAITATRKSTPTAAKYPYSLYLISTSGNDINLYQNGATSEQGLIRVGGATQANMNSTVVAANTQFTQAAAYKLNSFAQSVNAGTLATDTAGTVPTLSEMQIGSSGGSYQLNGWVSKLNYWPQRLTDNEVKSFSK